MSYNISKEISLSFNEAIKRVKEALQSEGFGAISEIDLKAKFKEKLNIDFGNYTIFGACNPGLAYKAFQKEENIGVMLPCNILVQEKNNNTIVISAVNPMESIGAVKNDGLNSIAKEVSVKLDRVINKIS
jgi:uncharacterized protein (DUF302 family)